MVVINVTNEFAQNNPHAKQAIAYVDGLLVDPRYKGGYAGDYKKVLGRLHEDARKIGQMPSADPADALKQAGLRRQNRIARAYVGVLSAPEGSDAARNRFNDAVNGIVGPNGRDDLARLHGVTSPVFSK